MVFSMPMYREFVPKSVRPWIYVFFAIVFQLSGGIYLGTLSNMMGATSFMREDVLMIGLCGVVGVCMPFPLLFRFKFRFTNRQLLLGAALGIALCNLLCMHVQSIPVLCVISFIAGFLKLCGTFECMSNIQLWMAPGRDFSIFFPLLYMIVVGCMNMSSWVANQLTYHFGSWMMMHWFMIGLLLIVALTVSVLTRNVRLMPKVPMISVDWLGCVLWSLFLLEGIWIFTYGEYYNWLDSNVFRTVCMAWPVTLAICIARMRHIRHPFIDPAAFKYRNLYPVLGLFLVLEVMCATPKSLQNVFTSAVLGYGAMTTARFSVCELVGTLFGCSFVLWWIKVVKLKYTSLLSIGFTAILIYQLIMYFGLSPHVNVEMFYLPTMLSAFGYAIFFAALTIYLEEIMPFQHFFMGLTICGFIRNGLVETIASAGYAHALRYYTAEYSTHYFSSSMPADLAPDITGYVAKMDALAPLMSSVKTVFGWSCFIGAAVLLVFLLYGVEPVRRTLKKMPSWKSVGMTLKRSLGIA